MASSVIVGLQITPELRKTVQFLQDRAIQRVIINGTCERCPLSAEECDVRHAPPTNLLQNQKEKERRQELEKLIGKLKRA